MCVAGPPSPGACAQTHRCRCLCSDAASAKYCGYVPVSGLLCCRGRSGNVRHWCPVMCPCAGAPAIYTQRVLRALASLVSGREMTSDAELLDSVAMVRVPAVRAEARSGAPSSSGAWHSSEIRGRSADPRVCCTGNGAHGRVRFRHHHVGRQGGE